MNDRFLIYGLIDPQSGALRYIGKSSYGMKRARDHAYPSRLKKDRSRCGNWIKSLQGYGLTYRSILLQSFGDDAILADAERFWIAYFKKMGCELLNHTDGGEGCPGRAVSPETREKLRRATLGNKNALGKKQHLTLDQRVDLAERARRRSADAAIRAKISATLTGRKCDSPSAETRRKISEKLKGHSANVGSGRPKGSFSKKITDSAGNLYLGLDAVAKNFGVTTSHISHILKGRRPNPWGLKEV